VYCVLAASVVLSSAIVLNEPIVYRTKAGTLWRWPFCKTTHPAILATAAMIAPGMLPWMFGVCVLGYDDGS
jgi:hypothetical protein